MTTVDLTALKRRYPLGDVVEGYGVQLFGRGRVRQGVCPFHEENEGSFTVYADSERWYCFGCGEGGDVLDFIGRIENLDLPQAIRRLNGGAGSDTSTAVVRPGPVTAPRRTTVPPPFDPTLLTAAARFYAGWLRRSPQAQAYLRSRGILPGTAARLGLGYAPGGGLRAHLAAAGFPPERLRNSGLFVEQGERFAGMVVVPDLTTSGRVQWLAGRAIDPGRRPRFQSPPGPKPVLGTGRLGTAPPWVVLTEGLFDWLTLAQWGIPACAALATQGAERITAALRGCSRIFLAFDADDAGRSAAERFTELLGPRAAVVALPRGTADVAELATRPHGYATFRRLLTQAARAAA